MSKKLKIGFVIENLSISKSTKDLLNMIQNDAENFEIPIIINQNKKKLKSIPLFFKRIVRKVKEEGVLSIVGNKKVPSENTEVHQTYRGIANRSFIRKFSLGEYVEVNSAEFKDGLLTVELEEVLPPEKKPKHISIK